MQTGAFLTENQKQVQEAFYRSTVLDLKEASAVENGKRISIGPVEVTEVCNKHQSFTHIILVLSYYSWKQKLISVVSILISKQKLYQNAFRLLHTKSILFQFNVISSKYSKII